MREVKATRIEAAKIALRYTSLSIFPAMIVSIALLFIMTPQNSVPLSFLIGLPLGCGAFLGIMFFIMIYLNVMEEPTRIELENREREQAKKLLCKYPDLRDSK